MCTCACMHQAPTQAGSSENCKCAHVQIPKLLEVVVVYQSSDGQRGAVAPRRAAPQGSPPRSLRMCTCARMRRRDYAHVHTRPTAHRSAARRPAGPTRTTFDSSDRTCAHRRLSASARLPRCRHAGVHARRVARLPPCESARLHIRLAARRRSGETARWRDGTPSAWPTCPLVARPHHIEAKMRAGMLACRQADQPVVRPMVRTAGLPLCSSARAPVRSRIAGRPLGQHPVHRSAAGAAKCTPSSSRHGPCRRGCFPRIESSTLAHVPCGSSSDQRRLPRLGQCAHVHPAPLASNGIHAHVHRDS